MCPTIPALLEVAPSFILVIPGFLPLFLFAQSHVTGPSTRSKRAPIICIFVSLLGPLAVISGGLAITVLVVEERHRHLLWIAQVVVQSFLELAYRIPILYLISSRSFLLLASEVEISRRRILGYANLYSLTIFATFVLTVVHTSLLRPPYPIIVVLAVNSLATVFPIPLLFFFTLATQHKRARRIWVYIILIQLMSAGSAACRIPDGPIYEICAAFFATLWGGSIITLFYTFCSAPLQPPNSTRPRLLGLPPSHYPLSTSSPILYENPIIQPNSANGPISSEDFTALRDPFASPKSVSPSPRKSPLTLPPLTPPTFPHVRQPSPFTLRQVRLSTRSTSRRSGRDPQSSNSALEKTASSESTRALVTEENEPPPSGPSGEDSFFLNDEALLSQVLLHSLTMEANPTTVVSVNGTSSDIGHSVYSSTTVSESHGWPPRRSLSSASQRPSLSRASYGSYSEYKRSSSITKRPSLSTITGTDGLSVNTVRTHMNEVRRHISVAVGGHSDMLTEVQDEPRA